MSHTSLRPLWVFFLLNGDPDPLHAVKVNISSIHTIPELCAVAYIKLRLAEVDTDHTLRPKYVFSQDGTLINDIADIYADDKLYFSSSPNFLDPVSQETPPETDSPDGLQNPPGDGYLFQAAALTTGLVSGSYQAFSSVIRSHAPQQVVNSFTTMEDTISYYSQPIVQSTLPYLSTGLTWSDQTLKKCVAVSIKRTNEFLETPTGQSLTHFKENVKEYTNKAVESFRNVIAGNEAGNVNPSTVTLTEEQKREQFVANLRQGLGDKWDDSMIPWANSNYDDMTKQLQAGVSSASNSPNQQAMKTPL
jgi:uncharacterized protein YaaR (DUF327 family)